MDSCSILTAMKTVRRPFFLLSFIVLIARRNQISSLFFDDLGWSELGCYKIFNETPHLDQMARGLDSLMLLPTVCSPIVPLADRSTSCASWYLGLSPSKPALPVSRVTLPKIKENGYATAWWGNGIYGIQVPECLWGAQTIMDLNGIRAVVKALATVPTWPYVFEPSQFLDWYPKNRLGENEYLTDRFNLRRLSLLNDIMLNLFHNTWVITHPIPYWMVGLI